jgi:folate-binding protein YgfZ
MTTAALDELTALRTGAAFCSPDRRFPLRITGADALAWIDRIASRKVADIQAGHVVAATLMDGKGRMRTDLRIIAPGPPADGLLLDLPLSHRAALLKLLDMYIITEQVTLADLSAEQRIASVLGPDAAAVMETAGLPVPEAGRVERPGEGVLVLASRTAALPGFDLVFETDLGRDLVGRLYDAGAVRVDVSALDVVRISAGVPWFERDLADAVIPLEAHLDELVSVNTGCYPGQEVVARIHNLGQVARRLVGLECAGQVPLQAGAELTLPDGKMVGKLTSVAFDPASDKTVALGFVRRLAWDDDCRVLAGDVELCVHSLLPA